MLENFINNLETFNEIDYIRTFLSLICCIILSFALKYLYIEKSISLSNKSHIANVLPMLSLITFLVILIVKSSLALSLGLVGALSIVRFRTPIKEPEELIYLFMAIALGLGYGAGQIIPTTSVAIIIFLIIWFFIGNNYNKISSEYNLIINCGSFDKNKDFVSNEFMVDKLKTFFKEFELVKYESSEESVNFVVKVMIDDVKKIDLFKKELSNNLNKLEINYYYSNPVY